MDQVLAQAKVEISATSRVWEPQRAYEKKLGTALSKDKGEPNGRTLSQGSHRLFSLWTKRKEGEVR